MKRFFAILLLAAFVLPFAGQYATIKYQVKVVKKKIKWRMIAGLDCAELMDMRFSREDARTILNWKHSKEFEYKGQWYDIVYTDTIGTDSLHYWLFWDHEETNLNRQLAGLVAKALTNDPANQEKNTNFSHFTKDLYCSQLSELIQPATTVHLLKFSLAGAIIHRPSAPFVPPPEQG